MILQDDFDKSYLNVLLRDNLVKIFGPVNDEILLKIKEKVQWHRIKEGIELFHQGDEGLQVYFVLVGKVVVNIESPDHEIIYSGERQRGEIIGEMSILTGDTRTATIIAARDTILASLSKGDYERIIEQFPLLASTIAKNAIRRLIQAQNPRQLPAKPSTICLIPITDGLDMDYWVDELVNKIATRHKVLKLEFSSISDVWRKEHDIPLSSIDELEESPELQSLLEGLEAKHDFLVLKADGPESAWSKKCVQIADTIYLVANSTKNPEVGIWEKEIYERKKYSTNTLVLIHPAQTLFPSNTDLWLRDRKIKNHLHLRDHHRHDLERWARLLTGRTNGLVLSGGGAKGFAHLGAYQALLECGIPIDYVGGTSIGALMGAFISFGLPPDQIKLIVRDGALQNPTSDYSLFPFLSLIKGKRMKKLIKNAIRQSVGSEINIEDSWLGFFAVSCNYTQSVIKIHTHGKMIEALSASIAIPGALPPVLNETDLLMDGGSFNNFPTDIMNNEMQVTNIVGVELKRDKIKSIDLDKLPSGWQLFMDKLRPKNKRKYDLPSLLSILLNASLFSSDSQRKKQREYADIYLYPDVGGFNMLDWDSFDILYDIGYQYTKSVLNKMNKEELENFK